MSNSLPLQDVALAARLVSAIAASDVPGWSTAISEARRTDRMEGLLCALAVRCAQLAAEAYGADDVQRVVDGFALDACARLNQARGTRTTDDDD